MSKARPGGSFAIRRGWIHLLLVAVGLPLFDAAPAGAQPELIAPGRPEALDLRDGYVYFAEQALEFCSQPGTLKKVRAAPQSPPSILLSGCALAPAAVLADSSVGLLYFADASSVSRIWVHGGNPQPIGAVGAQDLVQDDSHLYSAGLTGIRRFTKATGVEGPFESVPGGMRLPSLALRKEGPLLGALLWAQQGASPGTDAIAWRATRFFGTTVLVPLLDDPRFLVHDSAENFVYFSEGGGKIRRKSTGSGAQLETLHPGSSSFLTDGLALDATHVYWSESMSGFGGRIRRMPKAGGPIVDLAIGLQGGPRSLRVDDQFVYFGLVSSGVYRVRKDAAAPLPDLQWSGLEVTQGIQNLANSALDGTVEQKPTIVRAYPSVVGSATRVLVDAELHGERNGVALPGSPLRSTIRYVPVQPGQALQRDGHQVFEFWLPESWRTAGIVTLRAVLNPERALAETDYTNNQRTRDQYFAGSPPICLRVLPVRGHSTPFRVTTPGFWEIIDRFESLIPRSNVWVQPMEAILEETQCCHWWGPFPYPYFGPYEIEEDSDWIIAKLMFRIVTSADPARCDRVGARVHMVGLVNPADITTTSGYANYVFNVSWVAMQGGGVTPYGVPEGGGTLAQEVSHNYMGIKLIGNPWGHVACGTNDSVNDKYPYPPCQIAPSFSHDTFWGYDPISRTPIPPAPDPTRPWLDSGKDYMSYGFPKWVSDYTWSQFYHEPCEGYCGPTSGAPGIDEATLAPLSQAPSGVAEKLLVIGLVLEREGRALLDTVWRVPEGFVNATHAAEFAPPPGWTGPFSLVLLDAAGRELARHPFALLDSSQEFAGEARTFAAWVPFDPATREIRVLKQERSLEARAVSPNAPVLQVTSPSVGEYVGRYADVRWTGKDPDGGTVLYAFQYSHDGTEWATLLEGHPGNVQGGESSLQLDLGLLPGSASRSAPGSSWIRVIANDGVNTAMAVAGPFRVAPRPPLVHIEKPDANARVYHDDELVLLGRGLDAEDGALDRNGLRWLLDGVYVRDGRDATIGPLAPGAHQITLCAQDSDKQEVCDSVTITSSAAPTIADADGDGVPDDLDRCPFAADPSAGDTDGDGVGDACDVCSNTSDATQIDGDADGLGDACDPCPTSFRNDSDGDGACDEADVCPGLYDPAQTDTDADGRGDGCDVCPAVTNPAQGDCDGDGQGDACELEPDCNRNRVPDACDIANGHSQDGAADGIPDECQSDADLDGVADALDNCVLAPNPTQLDADHDGYGNACDPDLNNDGVVNFADLAIMKKVFFKFDAVADLNGDDVVNFTDLAIMKKSFFKAPGPAAGKP